MEGENQRNARVFKNQFDEIVDEIKVVSWFWVLSRLKIASCLYYEWSAVNWELAGRFSAVVGFLLCSSWCFLATF
jgi:hypothetical protein